MWGYGKTDGGVTITPVVVLVFYEVVIGKGNPAFDKTSGHVTILSRLLMTLQPTHPVWIIITVLTNILWKKFIQYEQ